MDESLVIFLCWGLVIYFAGRIVIHYAFDYDHIQASRINDLTHMRGGGFSFGVRDRKRVIKTSEDTRSHADRAADSLDDWHYLEKEADRMPLYFLGCIVAILVFLNWYLS
jgi:hypothetical protein